ncbi:hypothetical protein G4Z16_20170 [Streptomyces bathyalis]|uniref:Uncharacterized protein n=1 Tax=Streptomyces bathyalis TaxID=2710756 RepID=A0A7T1T8F7_9ACTN|nr:hypothetical protein [Streptomyces bathyalis]QPP08327.1 hypothetical protein G4Z16_20170 [Streptomyces bathyalis]
MMSNAASPEDAPSTSGIRGLRVTAGIALVLLPVIFMLSYGLVLDDALKGEPTVLFNVSACLLAGSGLLGLAVLLLPARTVSRPARTALLVGQCGLMRWRWPLPPLRDASALPCPEPGRRAMRPRPAR